MEKELIGTIVVQKHQLPNIRVGQRVENAQLHELDGNVVTLVESSTIEKVEWLGHNSFVIETLNSIYFVIAE